MRKSIKRTRYYDDVWLGLIAVIVILGLRIPFGEKAKCEAGGGVYNQTYERCISKTGS
jgi:hypothetical protein